ncbi:hypothetical protein EDD16DRAFT_1529265 [Pisolithus croceorrhizus]|nr:hypothetical protein EDD16DRAFT_1529265 [Pisolithus croceorrhizus]
MLHAKLDSEITRTEKGAELTALEHKFLHLQTEKEAELVALVQSGPQEEACMDAEGISQVPLREVTAGLVTEEVVQMLRMDNLSPLYSTPHRHKGNSRKHRQLAAVKDEIMSGKEQNNNLASNRDFLSFKSPLHEVVMSFAEGSGPGPDPINLQWDFSSPVSSVWNQAVVNILLNKLHELGMEEQWATTPRSNEYWKEAIKQKFNWIKVMWNKGRPWRLKNDILETPAEVAARLMQEKMKDLKMVQKDMHRVVAKVLLLFNHYQDIFMHGIGPGHKR